MTSCINLRQMPSVNTLRRILDYNPETGQFIWLQGAGRVKPGTPAGTLSNGYLRIQVQNRLYWGHRLAWLLGHGEDPGDLEVDHIDGNGSNNRLSNLRLATHAQNLQNTEKPCSNKSGFKGVAWHRKAQKWRAYIQANGKRHYLGYFETPEEGSVAYLAAAKKLHGSFARAAQLTTKLTPQQEILS
jgi:hypothetical protein